MRKQLFFLCALLSIALLHAAESWPQLKFESGRSGNVPDRTLEVPLRLAGAAPLSDAVFTSPAVSKGKVYVVDGAGVAYCFDAKTLRCIWRVAARGGELNCNNISSPAVAGGYVHFGTQAGSYYVLNAESGGVVEEIRCGDPVFSAPVIGDGCVYFATLGSRVYSVTYDGKVRWIWDFVKEHLKFTGDRWSGEDWTSRGDRVTWRDQFCCTRDIALYKTMLVIPAGGVLLWLEDTGAGPALRYVYETKRENPATLGLSIDAKGRVYRQWHRRDNNGRVEVLSLNNGTMQEGAVPGTSTSYISANSLSFSSVSIRGNDVFRCRPEEHFGLCRHSTVSGVPVLAYRGTAPSIASPVLVGDKAVYGGLDGTLYVVQLDGKKVWSYTTAFGCAITAPAAVADGCVYFGCEDGYLYMLNQQGGAEAPEKKLDLAGIRTPFSGDKTGPRYNWYTSFADFSNTNTNDQKIEPPFRLRWIRRFKGTVKHFSVFGGGRMYTHTAEGQIFAVEQETGRLLWRRYFPGVHVSFTSPLYYRGKLYVPQAGFKECFIRCLDAASGKELWKVPFAGSPSWNRQQPPVVVDGVLVYCFSSGRYAPNRWLFEHQSTFSFPKDQKPLLKAWDLETGEEVWERDFSTYGSGGDDAGICLLDGTLYYSCYFGTKTPCGVTVSLDPKTGGTNWVTTEYALHAGCTISGGDGKLYLGGYNAVGGKTNHIWCLDASDGSLVWKSEPLRRAIHVVTIRDKTLFTHAQYRESYLLERATGRILKTFRRGYRCTRFTVSEPYLLGANLDIYDLRNDFALVSTGPPVDVLLCVGTQVSNGRLFYTANGAGLQTSLWCGDEAQPPPWSADAPR